MENRGHRIPTSAVAVIARAAPMDRERIGLYATFEEEFGTKLPPDFELAQPSSVKNAATAMEAHLADKGGDLV